MRHLLVLAIIVLTAVPLCRGDEIHPLKPSAKDKCPVCGMFVAKYPDFLTQIIYRDGSSVFFDGTKDMFKYYFEIQKYHPARKQSEIAALYVTDYYSLSPVNGYEATYITGSDIFGPMGRELIPFEKAGDAEEFMKDHKGEALMKFKDVALSLVKDLD